VKGVELLTAENAEGRRRILRAGSGGQLDEDERSQEEAESKNRSGRLVPFDTEPSLVAAFSGSRRWP
jgi:hypothetical protein